eukprot:1138350-Pelagomonas_calceolata.AAC.6
MAKGTGIPSIEDHRQGQNSMKNLVPRQGGGGTHRKDRQTALRSCAGPFDCMVWSLGHAMDQQCNKSTVQ